MSSSEKELRALKQNNGTGGEFNDIKREATSSKEISRNLRITNRLEEENDEYLESNVVQHYEYAYPDAMRMIKELSSINQDLVQKVNVLEAKNKKLDKQKKASDKKARECLRDIKTPNASLESFPEPAVGIKRQSQARGTSDSKPTKKGK